MQYDKYDILVAGAGIAGISAAVAAGRLGASVLLVEHYPFPGGMSSAGMVSPFMKSMTGGKNLVKGIYLEIENRMREHGGMIDNGFYSWAFRAVANQMLNDAGVHMAYNADVTEVFRHESRITGVKLLTPAGYRTVQATQFIDTTGDAQLVFLGGFPWLKGDENTGKLQALTLFFRMGGIDVKRTADYSAKHPGDFLPWMDFNFDFSRIVSIAGYKGLIRKAKDEGRFPSDVDYVFFTTLPSSGEGSFNTTNILGIDPTTSFTLTQAEQEGHRQVAQIVDFLNRDVPGFEMAYLIDTAVQVGVRETRRAQAQYMVNGNDILSGAKFNDAVARACYGIDIHGQKGEESRMDELQEGDYYEVPLRSLRVLESDNLFVAGRCIGSTREGHAALRIQPTASATGEACGVAAALAVRYKTLPDEVPYILIREHLAHNLD
ncbi:MAG TPA: FAD-dependent oxidoreductase [Bacteroidales bacterium]|nr:FAD-dependent oxidoreductase [Bacteroidales bacterium]